MCRHLSSFDLPLCLFLSVPCLVLSSPLSLSLFFTAFVYRFFFRGYAIASSSDDRMNEPPTSLGLVPHQVTPTHTHARTNTHTLHKHTHTHNKNNTRLMNNTDPCWFDTNPPFFDDSSNKAISLGSVHFFFFSLDLKKKLSNI